MTDTSHTPRSAPDVRVLIELLTQQRDLYSQLKRLSGQQLRLIDAGDTEQLLGVLSQRQSLVDGLARINGELAPYREGWNAVSQGLPAGERDQVRGLLDAVEGMLGEIVELDEQARGRLQVAQRKVGDELSRTARAGVAMHSYRQAYRPDARFADQRG